MLNKLLKRCMPWMDKGRWVQIRIDGTDPSNLEAVYNNDEIQSVEIITGDNLQMVVHFNSVPHIIDYKYCPRVGFNFITAPEASSLYSVSNTSINVIVPCPGDYWFYMR